MFLTWEACRRAITSFCTFMMDSVCESLPVAWIYAPKA